MCRRVDPALHDGRVTGWPAWVADAAGPSLRGARRARWGFRHETWIVDLASGERRVLQRRTGGPSPDAQAAIGLRRAVRGAGLPTPEPVRREAIAGSPAGVPGAGAFVLELPYVEAAVAAELLGSDEGAAEAGRLCGLVAARLATIVPPVGIRETWASGERLAAAATAWRRRAAPLLPPAASEALGPLLVRAEAALDDARPRLAHGDLAPVNVLVRDGDVAAVLDLDRVQLANPAYDAAWFSWVVSFHHPDVAGRACAAFTAASGTSAAPEVVGWLWPLLLLERLAEADDDVERETWASRLAAAVPPA